MLDEIERLAKILVGPGLEPETAKLINETIRDQLGKYREGVEKPAEPTGNIPLDPTLFQEWINGPQSQQEGG